ncbi:hypothetical protein AB0K60_25545 [Thermopolyspora sp. NPDC052614]|uniref:hypothetical protein n=1 Tax=Thermopolyspora sp. NPDC052614 TaxID=3155682 RepID=UPI0034239247
MRVTAIVGLANGADEADEATTGLRLVDVEQAVTDAFVAANAVDVLGRKAATMMRATTR